jgi:MAP3K TRAFs-binding domain
VENPVPASPLCFVLMPFGRKTDATGRTTDFDAVYRQIINPAVVEAGLDPIRADEEKIGGAIHKPMFERLMLCQYAVADITGANPNVYYELGIRHAMRPSSTVILFAEGTTLPFDIALLRGVAYRIGEGGVPLEPESSKAKVAAQLHAARANPHDDSPLFQLIQDMPRFEVDHSKTDTFREKFSYSKPYKERLAEARGKGNEAAHAVREVVADPKLANLSEVEAGVVIDLYLSLRDVKAYGDMVDLYHRMPSPLQRARVTREQLAFALNREGRAAEAEVVLKDVLKEFGPSSETYGLLGRIYKDRWEAAKKAGRALEAPPLLKNAIGAYLSGFQTDWRDAYPGVNAVTLMEMQEKPDARQAEILPVVRYAASQKARTNADYWDHATLLELAVIGRDTEDAVEKLGETLASVPPSAPWQLETTERNLRLIRELRLARGEDANWIAEFEQALAQKRNELASANPAS